MRWQDLTENEQLDLLALYVTGNLPRAKKQELAHAALDDEALFEALGDLTPLKVQLADREHVESVLAEYGGWRARLALWWERRDAWIRLDLTPRGYAFAGTFAICCGIGIFLWVRANSRGCSLDLAGGPAIFLSQCDQLAMRMTDPQVDSNQVSTGQDLKAECSIEIKGKSTVFTGRARDGFVEVTLPASALRNVSSAVIVVKCGQATREYPLEDRIRQ